MNGYEVIEVIKVGMCVMQFVVLPLCVVNIGLFTYGLATIKK